MKKRIEAIVKNRRVRRLNFLRKAALAIAAMVTVAAPVGVSILNAQDAALQFEVASLKPSRPSTDGSWSQVCNGGPGTTDPGLFTCSQYTFDNLLAEAFDLAFYQLPNAHRGMERYDISARVPPGTKRAQFRTMFQNLLIERFRLKYHWEKKEMPLYDIAVAKGGLKMKESPLVGDLPAGTSIPTRSRIDLRGGKWTAYGVQIGQIESILTGELQAPITDSTGLTAKYDFILTWKGRAAAPDDPEPSLVEAIQQQLGLKVEKKKAPMDTFVVDHAEKTPIGN